MLDAYDTSNPTPFTGLLQLNLSSLPENLTRNVLNSSHRTHKSALFNLTVMHTLAILELKKGNELAPVHYSNLLTSVGHLASLISRDLGVSVMLASLSWLVTDLYSGCLVKERCQALSEGLLSVEVCSPGADLQPMCGVELTVPSSSVSTVGEIMEHVRRTASETPHKYVY